jgi:hypothetical protein
LTLDARLEFAHSVDVNEWATRHSAGQVPDRWPYGLNRLAEHGIRLTARRPMQRGGRTVGVLSAAARRLTGLEIADALRPRRGADLVIAWDERSGLPAAAVSDIPVASGVIWLTEATRIAPGRRWLIGRGLARAHRLWCLAKPQTSALVAIGAPAKRTFWLPFGVDADFWEPAVPQDSCLVVSVGNDKHRDWSTVLRATADFDTTLVTRREVRARRLIPHLPHHQLRALYHEAAVVVVGVVPNLHVSGVTVVLEAMACARAVIVSDTPGMSDYVEHGETGLLVPPGDADAMREAIRELLVDPQRTAEMGRSARRAVEDRFSTAHMAASIAAIVRD